MKTQIPTEDGIDMQDIRLIAGEGKLSEKTIQQAIAEIRRRKTALFEIAMSAGYDEMVRYNEELGLYDNDGTF